MVVSERGFQVCRGRREGVVWVGQGICLLNGSVPFHNVFLL